MFSNQDLNLRTKVHNDTVSVHICDAENRPIRNVDMNYVEGFEMWCWRRMETISWADRVRNEEVLRRVKRELNVLHTRRQSKAHWAGHSLSGN